MNNIVPHAGSLSRRTSDGTTSVYVVPISTSEGRHELAYTAGDFEFARRLFAILDTESRGVVSHSTVKEFVMLRCPVFWRRDDDLRKLNLATEASSPTFDEIWASVTSCGISETSRFRDPPKELGVEGWVVFCRFIALAQYLEAKRKFSARHLQQTMRHRNAPRGSELVMVEVPPPESPAVLSPLQLANYEQKSSLPLPLPELDLDHSLLAAHDSIRRQPASQDYDMAKISLFGASCNQVQMPTSHHDLEFVVTYFRVPDMGSSVEPLMVRRSMADMKWLDDTFASQRGLGGTLCGRILPPFPGGKGNRALSSHFEPESVINSGIQKTGGAIATAAKGVGKIRDAAKSIWGSYVNAPVDGEKVPPPPQKKTPSRPKYSNKVVPESYYNPNLPLAKARHLERYLNYLLEHPALSTSFPLSTILKASQSGLEAAKKLLDDCKDTAKELNDESPHMDDGKILLSSFLPGASPTSQSLRWVRTAAQAAMALKVHGMLETTGMNSASARLQHASLPQLGGARIIGGWQDGESDPKDTQTADPADGAGNLGPEGSNFEEGVVNVASSLQSDDAFEGEGYDMLPLPVPAPERTILSAGSENQATNVPLDREERFFYGASGDDEGRIVGTDESDQKLVLIGEISVDDNIDKLREVIGSVDNTLSRCLASSGGTGKAQRERQVLHLDIIQGLDSWEGMRGQFVSQRALMKGVVGIEQSKEILEESCLALIDDISWQTSLANSAVSAAEEVRSAVRVSRTAANAKAAASSAAMAAQQACDSGTFSNIDEARAAQTRASIARSRAIHAAVVEHEAKTVKRRATLALAHDVKCWNIHRKREMIRSILSHARSQHEGARRAVDAWSSFRDGFVGSTVIPSSKDTQQTDYPRAEDSPILLASPAYSAVQDEVSSTIYDAPSQGQSIVAVEHDLLGTSKVSEDEIPEDTGELPPTGNLPFATADPIEDRRKIDSEDVDLLGLGNENITTPLPQTGNTAADPMSASIESLLDGLMTWGGGFDTEEDHFNLPVGMAASIMLEESGAMDSSKIA